MPIARSITATLLVIGLAACAAPTRDERIARPLSAVELQHRRQTQEGARASRAMPPSPRPATPPNNGIVQIPIDTTKTRLELKDQSNPSNSSMLRTDRADQPLSPLQQPQPLPPPCFYAPGMKTASLVKAFPEVTWHVCVNDVGVKGLWVGPVNIRRTPSGPWMRVLYQAGLADIFVAYHDDSLRFYDMRWTGWLDQVFTQDAGPNGSLILLTNEPIPTVVAEVRDRGLAWLCKEAGNSIVRRGEEFVVWAVSDAGNYDNIIQFGFRDDGGMTFRMGNTGFNAGPPTNPSDPPTKPSEPHVHNALWRVDMDLNGSGGDSAYWITHTEPNPTAGQATDTKTAFGVEGARKWNYKKYASLLIEDSATNAWGNKLGYEFTPAGTGMSRHYGQAFGWPEVWTRNDVYVTVFHDNEFGWLNTWASLNGFHFDATSPPGGFIWTAPDDYLLAYLNPPETVTNNDLVVWIKSAAHHHPTDEDRSNADLSSGDPASITGVTLIHWSGFNVEPHNLFDVNPLGGPVGRTATATLSCPP